MESWTATSALHPHRLATIATLRGRTPSFALSSKILLLGIPDSGDLVPLAAYLPDAQIVAVDESAQRLREAEEHINALRLENVTMVEQPLTTTLKEVGPFDFILVREAFSRQEGGERSKLLAACSEALEEEGLLALCYPALPGWGPLATFSAWIRTQIDHDAPVDQRILDVRRLVEPLRPQADSTDPSLPGLASLAAVVGSFQDREIEDVLLDPSVTALRLRDVVEAASSSGLHYLGDTERHPTYVRIVQETAATLGESVSSLTDVESLAELSLPPAHRCSLFSRHGAHSDPMAPLVELEIRLVALRLLPEKGGFDLQADTEVFTGPHGTRIEVESRLLRAVIALLSEAWPCSVPVLTALNNAGTTLSSTSQQWAMQINEEEIKEVKERLLHLCELGLAELRTEPLPMAREIDEKPRVHDLVKYQAERGSWVTSPLHFDVELGPFLHSLLRTLDGERHSEAIEAAMALEHKRGVFNLEVDGELPQDTVSEQFVLRGQIIQGLRQLHGLGLLQHRRDQDASQ